MPELHLLLAELRRRVNHDIDHLQLELDRAEHDYRFGWQTRGKAMRRELADLWDLRHATDIYLEAIT